MNSTANDGIYPGVLSPRESAKWIVDNTDPKLIRIEQKAVEKVAEMICHSTADQLKQLEFSACEVQPKNADQAGIDWIFFIDSINFSFWSDQSGGHYFVTHNGKTYSGYFAVCAALNRTLERGLALTSAKFMAKIDGKTLGQCLQGDDGIQIPMLAERVEIIRENGKILKEKFNGSFLNCLIQSNGKAQKLLQLIVENFPSFRDFAVYKGKKVSFLKRAQILVADIHNCLGAAKNELNIGKFEDISSLTMFADYRVPQALAYLGVLEYSPELIDRLKLDELLENGCELEVQLRAFSISACDAILESIQKLVKSPHFSVDSSNLNRLRQFCAVNVDVWIWLWRRQNAELIEEANVPFHRCRSIFY